MHPLCLLALVFVRIPLLSYLSVWFDSFVACLSVCMHSFVFLSQCLYASFSLIALVFVHVLFALLPCCSLVLLCLSVFKHPFACLSQCLYVLFCFFVLMFVNASLEPVSTLLVVCLSVCIYPLACLSQSFQVHFCLLVLRFTSTLAFACLQFMFINVTFQFDQNNTTLSFAVCYTLTHIKFNSATAAQGN